MKDQKIIESVLNIDMLTDELGKTIRELFKHKIPHTEQLTKTVVKYNYILVCSFLEELDIFNSNSRDNAQIRDIMWCISPLVKALKSYDGIKKGRNAFFAHYNRDATDNFYPWWRSLKDTNLPRLVEEVVFINAILGTIRAIIVSQYLNELEEIKKLFKPEMDEYFKFVEEQEKIAPEKIKNLEEIVKVVNERTKEKNIIIRRIM